MDVLPRGRPPFPWWAAYALALYTGVVRHTKDLDLFVRPADAGRTLETLRAAGWRTETTFTHWLAKAFGGEDFIDVIFNSGNGLYPVDDGWFEHAVAAWRSDGRPRPPVPAGEIIWQKAFIRERRATSTSADVAHMIRARPTLDWPRLLEPLRAALAGAVRPFWSCSATLYPSKMDLHPAGGGPA